MSGAVYHRPTNIMIHYSCKTGTTFLRKCKIHGTSNCECEYQKRLGFEDYLMDRVNIYAVERHYAVVRDPVERAISAFQHCALRLYFPDRREVFLKGGDSHWKPYELPVVMAWRDTWHDQLSRYMLGEHPDDIVALWYDWAANVLPIVIKYNCHFAPQLNLPWNQDWLHTAELWVTPKLREEMQRLFPNIQWNRRSTHRGGWYFNISRSGFYDAIASEVHKFYPADFELYDRAVEMNLHKYPALRKTRLNTV